jgi:hypothetical protein
MKVGVRKKANAYRELFSDRTGDKKEKWGDWLKRLNV